MQEIEGLISVIIPCYNSEKYLHETITSVLKQRYLKIEIIVINDGSTDGSEAIIIGLKNSNKNIEYYATPNNGVSSARDLGLQKARGEFVLFLDADDILEDSFLTDRVNFLLSNSDCGLCGSDVLMIDDKGKFIDNAKAMKAPEGNILEQILLYQHPYVSIPSNLLIRKKILTDNGIYFRKELSSTADKFFLCQLGKITICKNINGGRLLYRVVKESMSHSISKKLLLDNIAYFELLKSTNIVPLYIYRDVLLKNYYILAALSFRLKDYSRFIYFYWKYILTTIRLNSK